MLLLLLRSPPLAPSLPFSDNWTGTDGNPWDASKWINYVETNVANSATIQANTGRLSASGAAFVGSYFSANVGAVTDFEAVFSLAIDNATAEQYSGLFFRAQESNAQNGYLLQLRPQADAAEVIRVTAGAETVLQIVTAAGIDNVTRRWFKVQMVGSAIKVRWWNVGNLEPSTWRIETSNALYASGAIGPFIFNGGSVTTRFIDLDDFTITAPPSNVAVGVGRIVTFQSVQRAAVR